MPIPLGLIIAGSAISSGLGALGQRGAARRQAKESQKDRAEGKRQFDLDYLLKKAAEERDAQSFQRRQSSIQQTSPMRQQIVDMLFKRLGGMAPGSAGGAAPPATGLPNVAGGGQVNPEFMMELMRRFGR